MTRARLRRPARQAATLVVICAWCPDFNPLDTINHEATHGICPACAAKFEEGITPCRA